MEKVIRSAIDKIIEEKIDLNEISEDEIYISIHDEPEISSEPVAKVTSMIKSIKSEYIRELKGGEEPISTKKIVVISIIIGVIIVVVIIVVTVCVPNKNKKNDEKQNFERW